MRAFLLTPLFKYVAVPALIALALGGAYAWVTTGAYNRGHAAAETEHRQALDKMEAALRDALRKNENLTDPELDCRLKRVRNPSAPCP